jgi:hypothetical protein
VSELDFIFVGKFFSLTGYEYHRWLEAFPNVSVYAEFRLMEEWLIANPRRRKKNYRRFITNWLKAEQRKFDAVRSELMVGQGPVCVKPVRR